MPVRDRNLGRKGIIMDTNTKFAIRRLVESPAKGSKGNVGSAKELAIALKGIKSMGSDAYAYATQVALVARKSTLQRDTLWQRQWGTKVSKRIGRGNHHDSWSIREGYVRCSGHYADYLEFAHSKLQNHPNWDNSGVHPKRRDRI